MSESRALRILIYTCIFLLVANLAFMWRLDIKHERLIDYGEFKGSYESERRVISAEIRILKRELETQRAWVTSVKTDLGEMLAITEDQRMRDILFRMIESSESVN